MQRGKTFRLTTSSICELVKFVYEGKHLVGKSGLRSCFVALTNYASA
jgi:hypothetical protein